MRIIQIVNNKIMAYGDIADTAENREYLETLKPQGYQETQDEYVQAFDGQFYLKGTEPAAPEPTYQELRAAEYPDFKEYLDAQVKLNSDDETLIAAGQAQLEAYYSACLAVKTKYPKPE